MCPKKLLAKLVFKLRKFKINFLAAYIRLDPRGIRKWISLDSAATACHWALDNNLQSAGFWPSSNSAVREGAFSF